MLRNAQEGDLKLEISDSIAQEIVLQMKIVLAQEINFMNSEAIIIASTDPSRIGSFHGGAETAIKSKQPVVIEDDNQYTGSKKGINMPITFEKEVIGVIGITGEKEKVMKNGEIIKKMTEILIKEDFLKDFTLQKRNQSRYIIEKLLTFDYSIMSSDNNEIFNYNYTQPHISAVGQLENLTQVYYEEIYRILDQEFLVTPEYKYMILNKQLYLFVQNDNYESVKRSLELLTHKISRTIGQPYFWGMGPISQSEKEAKDSFQCALKALAWNVSYEKQPILEYNNMDIGLLCSCLSNSSRKTFSDKILTGIPDSDYNELKEVLFIYGETNKSLSKSAAKLFIHKNSFQYKLNKIYKYTGYDPKVLNDYVLLYLAFMLSDKR
ncbi:CdaR family transcriptional regulator [Amphibacillus sp. Q70]|uniref:CdaR family transcriptional regulator n=1 Tax=Amphibacillus sp. Q70 TaxID=3453416 RepID=UPI003F845CA6